MLNKIRYYIKHPMVLPGKYKRKIISKSKLYAKSVKNKISSLKIYINKIVRYPSVTVVIPTYKEIEYLNDAVNSVLNQNYKNNKIQIILSVNGDDENYFNYLKNKYKEYKNIMVIYTKVKGPAYARYYGLNFCKTEYITFLDDDDFLSPNYFKELLCKSDRNTKIIIGKLFDYKNGELNDDTYINDVINKTNTRITKDYFEISSLFSTICGKIYNTKYYKNFDFDRFDLTNTEDMWLWVRNVRKLNVQKEICKANSKEGYIRRLTENSRCRPTKEREFTFYFLDKLEYISMYERELLKDYNGILEKRFILNKINSQYNMLLNYCNQLDEEEKHKVLEIIKKKDIMFFNKSKLGVKKGIAFCHNFPPFIDASSMVASKRLSQISKLENDVINWDVVHANMENNRSTDKYYQMFYAQYQYTNIIRTQEKSAYFNEKSQYLWGKSAYEEVKNNEYEYIYSRSLWAGSHVAASLYKKEHPNTIWYAEFSDPIYKDTNGSIRSAAKEYVEEEAFLNTFWKDLEDDVFENADKIIFTNNSQMKYMTSRLKNKRSILDKSIVLNHPIINSNYCKIIDSQYKLDSTKINIGYFGTFYQNRNQDDLMLLLKNPNVVLHIFTSNTSIESKPNLRINEQVSNLEFLNIASKMDYLVLNDIDFSGRINPYLPSKLADYIASNTPIIAKVNENTELYKYNNSNIIKVFAIDNDLVNGLVKKNKKYNIDVIDINNYKELYTSLSLNYDLISQDIINGQINFGFNLDKLQYKIRNRIIWEFPQHIENENTFYLYYYGLRQLYILVRAYLNNRDISYIDLCNTIIKSFHKNYKKINNAMIYNDHAQAERIENLVFFLAVVTKNGINCPVEKECIDLIYDAIEKLIGDKYYQKHHNHGIIVDKALLIALYFLNESSDKIDFVAKRLNGQLESGFSNDGIHRENSTDYHFSISNNVWGCLEVLKKIDYYDFDTIREHVSKIDDYVIYSLKPNLARSNFGDSKGGKQLLNIKTDNNYLQYVLSCGKNGQAPEELMKYFESGYIFFREHFNKKDYSNSTWLSFKAGYSTRIHKHLDDLSICLYTKNHEIFIDPGMYNFVYKDKIKDYMESIPAHSTIFIKNRTYSKASGNGKYFKILRHQIKKEYDFATAVCIFGDVRIYRNIYYIRKLDCILINDNIYSNIENEYAQYYHLSNDVSLLNDNQNKTTLKLKNSNYKVNIIQLNKIDKLNILDGMKQEPYSLTTNGFGKYKNTITLEYDVKGKDSSFYTLIDIYNKNRVEIKKFDVNQITIEKDGKEVNIQIEKNIYLDTNVDKVKIEYNNNIFSLKNDSKNLFQHTIYIFKENDEIIKLPYTNKKEINVNLEVNNKEVCYIMYYLKTEHGESYNGLIGSIEKENNKIKTIKYEKLCVPKTISHEVYNDNSKYIFKANIDYNLKCNFKWFVYMNGAQIYNELNNSNQFEYKFDKKGEYVVIVLISDKYFKEFDYYEYEKINI